MPSKPGNIEAGVYILQFPSQRGEIRENWGKFRKKLGNKIGEIGKNWGEKNLKVRKKLEKRDK